MTSRPGLLYGFTAYLLWGVFPLYWPLLKPAGAGEILAHRVVWSLVVVLAMLAVLRRWSWLRTLGRRRLSLLAAAAVVIAVNWGGYIYGVNSGQVVETSLGYFINPLVTIAIGVVVLGERLRPAQWAAVSVGAVAVVVLAVDYGRPPWLALLLAFSFATYGYLKKQADVGAVESLTVETAVLAVPGLAYVAYLQAQHSATALSAGPGHALLLVSTGIVTTIPLLLFSAAATRIPLSVIGLLQYLAPVMQFLLGVLVYREPMPAGRLFGFALVWLAVGILIVSALHSLRAGPSADAPDADGRGVDEPAAAQGSAVRLQA